MIQNDDLPDANWDRTVRLLERVKWQIDRRYLAGHGWIEYFKDRHVIGRDRPVVEGVYLGLFAREAIVVSERDGVLRERYATLRARLRRFFWQTKPDELSVIRTVHAFVREQLPGGVSATEAIVARHMRADDADRKIDLTVFLGGRAGVCRHRALLGAYFLEKLIKDKILDGTCSIDRSEMNGGGHAWARFVSRKTGRILISDAGLDECGDIFEVEQKWGYRRPEDKPPIVGPTPSLIERTPLFDEIDATIAVAGLLWAAWHFGFSRLF